MTLNRRNFLRYASAASLTAGTFGALGTALNGFQTAHAADTTGYKALVCIFLLGGMDSHDMLLPYDQPSYDRFSELRSTLMEQYAGLPGGSSRTRDRLLPINPTNADYADVYGDRQFALVEEFSNIHSLFEQGNAAIIGNVGPLIEPLTRTQLENGTAQVPKRLFSHNDQQSTWMANAPEGAQFGWGGRFADAVIASGANANDSFAAITTRSDDVFLTGQRTQPYLMGLDGATTPELLDAISQYRDTSEGEQAYQALRQHFSASGFNRNHIIEQDVAAVMSNALEVNEAYNTALENATDLPVEFPRSNLGKQLRAVARTIQIRNELGMGRQVFFVGLGGFDTHSNQATALPQQLRQIDEAVAAFYQSMIGMGVDQDVTLFTASDFGRTLAVNGDGTDHGWGAHHFVIGSAVQGGSIQGFIPPHDLDTDWDVGSGRMIPSVSVDQYAEPLGRWFGLTDAELAAALPNLGNFSLQPEMSFLPVFR